MIRTILFDNDGVLVGTKWLFFQATRAAFRSEGGILSCKQWARWYLGEGKHSDEIAMLLGIHITRVHDAISKRDELFRDLIDRGVPLRPYVLETMSLLAQRFHLAVVIRASRRHYDRVHAASGLRDFFKLVVTSDECNNVKPSLNSAVSSKPPRQ